jgi:hypothetical protein
MVAEARQRVEQGVGQRGLVAHLEVRLGRDQGCDRVPERERCHADGARGGDEDGGDLIRGEQADHQAVQGSEGEHSEDDAGEQAPRQRAGRGGDALGAGFAEVHAHSLRVRPGSNLVCVVWQAASVMAVGHSYPHRCASGVARPSPRAETAASATMESNICPNAHA